MQDKWFEFEAETTCLTPFILQRPFFHEAISRASPYINALNSYQSMSHYPNIHTHSRRVPNKWWWCSAQKKKGTSLNKKKKERIAIPVIGINIPFRFPCPGTYIQPVSPPFQKGRPVSHLKNTYKRRQDHSLEALIPRKRVSANA